LNPAFAAFSNVVLLSGFSGADVAVLNGHERPFVRKAARTPAANPVLQRQSQRQGWLSQVLEGDARTPEVVGEGMVEGCFYFDMSFVAGRDAVAFLDTADFAAVQRFAGRIEGLMARLSTQAAEPECAVTPSREAVLAKTREIAERTGGAFAGLLDGLAEQTARVPEAVFARPATAVHGDLTFENILVDRGGGLWLIDSIDGPFTHYWLDMAKLFQECEGHWHAHRNRPIGVSVTAYLRRRWMTAAEKLDPAYPLIHYVLLALTFARILPYARSPDDVHFLERRVRSFTEGASRALTEYAG